MKTRTKNKVNQSELGENQFLCGWSRGRAKSPSEKAETGANERRGTGGEVVKRKSKGPFPFFPPRSSLPALCAFGIFVNSCK